MELQKKLRAKQIKFRELPGWGVHLRRKWEDSFVSHLSPEEKQAIFLHDDDGCCGFLWHVFSYEKRDCLVGEEAAAAFANQTKAGCYIFFQHSDDALLSEDAANLEPGDLPAEDVYVADKDFNWTYVQTHERMCGPYFCSKGKRGGDQVRIAPQHKPR